MTQKNSETKLQKFHSVMQKVLKYGIVLALIHVLQDLRPGDGALLVHMADDKHGDPLALGQLHQGHGAVLHLSHPSGGGIQVLVIQGLDGVHDQHVRLLAADAL